MKIYFNLNFFFKISILFLILILNLNFMGVILCDKNDKSSNKNFKDLEIEDDFNGIIYYRLGKILN